MYLAESLTPCYVDMCIIGKTTLLKHMASFDIEGFPTHHRVLHVKQEVQSSDQSVLQVGNELFCLGGGQWNGAGVCNKLRSLMVASAALIILPQSYSPCLRVSPCGWVNIPSGCAGVRCRAQ